MKITKKHLLRIYFSIWVICALSFYLIHDVEGIGYSLIVFYLIMPITSFILSLIIGKHKFNYYIPIIFGFMYMLLQYLTFGLLSIISLNNITYPKLILFINGTIISYIGLIIGTLINRFKK